MSQIHGVERGTTSDAFGGGVAKTSGVGISR